MADYSAYIPAVGSTTYPTQISNFITISEAFDTEIEIARNGEANLLDGINLKLSLSGGAMTGIITNFTSTGIDDNATAIALTINASNNILIAGTVDGRDLATDGTKLDNIEDNATEDQTNIEIKTAYEANTNTNEFSDSEQTNLGNQSGTNTGDMSNAQVKTAYEANLNTNEFSDTEQSKLAGIETGAEVNASFRGCLVYLTTNFVLPSSAYTPLGFAEEEYDTDSIHSTVTNNSRLIVPAGVTRVRLTGNVIMAGGSSGISQVNINKNGTNNFMGSAEHRRALNTTVLPASNMSTPVLSVTAGNYFELVVLQTSGADTTAYGGAFTSTWFAMEIIE